MALDEVQICNMAISHVGARSKIESFTEASEEARLCQLWYDYSRKQALEMHDWSFARKRVALDKHADAPPEPEWFFRYVFPNDCIAPRKIQHPVSKHDDAIPFDVEMSDDGETRSIVSNFEVNPPEVVKLVYTFDQENPATFTPFFVELLSWVLASHIAFSLTAKQNVETRALNQVASLTRAAPAMDANHKVDEPPRNADWIDARQGRRGFDARRPPWFPAPEGNN